MNEYLNWNEALAEAVYPAEEGDRPAYMSLDEAQRDTVSVELGIQQEEFESKLSTCVRNVLRLGSSGPVELFEHVNGELARWRRRRKDQRAPLLSSLY